MRTPPRPNILLIVTDQERARRTLPDGLCLPAHERLRREGVEFSEYHVNAVACSPARSTLYTGQHIQLTGVFDNAGPSSCLDPVATPTLGHMLQEEGYRTAYAGKWHLEADGLYPDAQGRFDKALSAAGFETYLPLCADGDSYGGPGEGARLDEQLAQSVARWMEAQEAQGCPWFMAVNFVNPHDIMFFDATGHQNSGRVEFWAQMEPAPASDLYGEDLGYDLPASFGQGFGGRPAVHRAFAEHCSMSFGDIPMENDVAWRRNQNYYFNCLRDVDRHIGTVLDTLDHCGAGNTVVILTSDHGEMAGAHGLRGKGPVAYRENFSVPLIIRHPDVAGGVASDALFCSLDFVPTLLSLTGASGQTVAQKWPALRGYDMAGVIEGGEPSRRTGILLNSSIVHANNPLRASQHARERDKAARAGEERPEYRWPVDYLDPGLKSFMRAVYDGRYRFARYFAPTDHHIPTGWSELIARNEIELYDTHSDPQEMNNLACSATEYQHVILRMNARLNQLIRDEVGSDDGAGLPAPLSHWRSANQAGFDPSDKGA